MKRDKSGRFVKSKSKFSTTQKKKIFSQFSTNKSGIVAGKRYRSYEDFQKFKTKQFAKIQKLNRLKKLTPTQRKRQDKLISEYIKIARR